MTAKSFQSYKLLTEPYEVSGKMYVKVQHPRTGNIRQVRWYTEKEYKSMYPNETISVSSEEKYGGKRHALGFDNGFIYLFKNQSFEDLEWFQNSIARYSVLWGWYIVSTDEIPKDLPSHLQPVKLLWEDVENATETVIKEKVDSLLYSEGNSQYIGTVKDRLDLKLTVIKNREIVNQFGKSWSHTFKDENGNLFSWLTSAKNLPEGSTYTLRGTVKEHRTYQNQRTTVLTRCTIQSEVRANV